MLPAMKSFHRHIVHRVAPALIALVLCTAIVIDFDHTHTGHLNGPDGLPCYACNLELLLGGCDAVVLDLYPVGAPDAFLAPDLPTCPLPGSQFQFLACGLRAPPAA